MADRPAHLTPDDPYLHTNGQGSRLPDDSELTLRRFYDTASVMMGTVELVGDDILHVSDNRAAAAAFGNTPEAMQGRTARELGVPEAYTRMWVEAYRRSVDSDEPVRFDYHHEGMGWLKVTVDHVGLVGGRDRFLYVVDDVSEYKRVEGALQAANEGLEARVGERTAELETANKRLEHDAFHDALTGLPNRLLFTDRLGHALERYHRDPAGDFAVVFLDLDHFKVVNDSLGHSVGDALLIAVGERLTGCVRDGDTVARFGGDEFTLLLEALRRRPGRRGRRAPPGGAPGAVRGRRALVHPERECRGRVRRDGVPRPAGAVARRRPRHVPREKAPLGPPRGLRGGHAGGGGAAARARGRPPRGAPGGAAGGCVSAHRAA